MLKRLPHFLVPACLFLLVFGLKLDLIHRYGSDLPRWDALDAEGLAVYLPLAEGKLGFADLFRPHNEHRIFWTKFLGLIELKLNGQWDARLQCTVNAALHSALAVLVFLFACRGLDRRLHAPIFVLTALLFGLPLAWENPLAGFHSQQYFLLGFSFGAICLLPTAPMWTARWWAGAACVLAALGTMGSGLFAAAVVLMILGLQGWRTGDLPGEFRRVTPTVALCIAALVLGALGRVSVNYHDSLKAGSVADFLRYTLHCLQWPAQDWSWLALILWLPVAVLAWRVARRRDPDAGSFPLILLGLAAWVLLQILATAYTRGAGGGMPSSRYADTLAFGLLVNGLALAWLWPRVSRAWLRAALPAAWLLAAAGPVHVQSALIFGRVLPDSRRHLEACAENVRRYLVTEDASHLDNPDIPYPGIRALRERIDPPAIRAILPTSVRPPLPLVTNGHPGPFVPHSTIRRARQFTTASTELPPPHDSLPGLEQRTVWFSDPAMGVGEWRSAPLRVARATVLRLLVGGHEGARLSVIDAGSRATIADTLAARVSPDRWRWIHVGVPAGEIVLQANIITPGTWLAFSEPVEMARGSYWCWRLGRAGRFLWSVAAGLSLLAGLGAWYCARREKALG